jgi:transposase-like protein
MAPPFQFVCPHCGALHVIGSYLIKRKIPLAGDSWRFLCRACKGPLVVKRTGDGRQALVVMPRPLHGD